MATSGELIREARLRAGLTQVELGELAGKDRAQIARWERHAVQPSFETLRLLLRACGYDLSSDLLVYQPVPEPGLEELARLTPQERLTRHDERRQATPGAAQERWEPLTLIAALERRRVAYVLVGALARILHGSDETTSLLEICPGMSDANQRRLTLALRDMGATADTPDAAAIIDSDHGRLGVVPDPAGTRGGHDDLRRRANRDPLLARACAHRSPTSVTSPASKPPNQRRTPRSWLAYAASRSSPKRPASRPDASFADTSKIVRVLATCKRDTNAPKVLVHKYASPAAGSEGLEERAPAGVPGRV